MSGAAAFEVAAGPALMLSFQRYRCPATGVVDAPATSCGSLPVLVSAADLLLVPCPPGEALWIGLLPASGTGATAVTVQALDAEARVDVPPAFAVFGVPRPDTAYWAFARAAAGPPPCERIDLTVTTADSRATVRIELIDPVAYESLAHRPLPPLDETAAYGGWRLP